MRYVAITATLLLALGAGCASRQPATGVMSTTGTVLVRDATVTNVRDITVQGGQTSGLGGVVGGILGGIAGSTLGGGRGSAVAGIGGGIAGGVTGDRVERAAQAGTTAQVTVRLANGEEQVFNVPAGETYRVGDKVRILSGNNGAQLSH